MIVPAARKQITGSLEVSLEGLLESSNWNKKKQLLYSSFSTLSHLQFKNEKLIRIECGCFEVKEDFRRVTNCNLRLWVNQA